MTVLLEACIDSVDSAIAAERAGAGRVELCAALADAGTTPSAGMIAAVVASVAIPVFVLVRPRGGDFVHSARELDVMRRDVEAARRAGAAGIVVGVLEAGGGVDVAALRTLVESAAGLPVTFHRAIDVARDPVAAMEAVIECGGARILTSGGAPTALAGAWAIGDLVRQGADRVVVMAGGGIREENVAEVVRQSGVREIHVRLARTVTGSGRPPRIALRKPLPADERAWEETDGDRVAEVLRLARAAAGRVGG